MLKEEELGFLPYFFTDPVFVVKEDLSLEGHLGRKEPQESTAEPQEKVEAKRPPIPYQGKNLKKILVLFQNNNAEGLSEKYRGFLGKILQAVRLSFDDVALVNVNLIGDSDFDQLNHFDARLWLSFGIARPGLLIDDKFPFYEVGKSGNVSLLRADALEEVESNKDKKVLLWNNLKILFP